MEPALNTSGAIHTQMDKTSSIHNRNAPQISLKFQPRSERAKTNHIRIKDEKEKGRGINPPTN